MTTNMEMLYFKRHRLLNPGLILAGLVALFIFIIFNSSSDYMGITDRLFSQQTANKLSSTNIQSAEIKAQAPAMKENVSIERLGVKHSTALNIQVQIISESIHTDVHCDREIPCTHCLIGASCATSAISSNTAQLVISQAPSIKRHFVANEYISQTLSPIKHPPRFS